MWKQKIQVRSEGAEQPLSRELQVCRNTIARIRKTLDLMEQKHGLTTKVFQEQAKSGSLPAAPDLQEDFEAWQSSCDSLRQWEELEDQYVQMQNKGK